MPQASKIAQSIQANHDLLSKNVLPQNFESITSQLTKIVGKFKGKSDQCESNIHQIETQWEKVKKFANTGKGYLNAKSEQIKSKVKNIDAVLTGIKQSVSKIKPQKLAQLPVQKNKSLQTMFKTLYAVLYHQKQTAFEWKSFKKLALKHQSGQDFLFRLVSINFKDLKHQQHEKLMILKNDPQFENTCVKTEHAFFVIDIADWIEYVCVGHQFSVQKMAAEKQYEKIRKDMSKKSGGSLELSKKFWKEAFDQLNSYQSNLQSLQAQLKSFKIGAQNSLETISQGNQWRNQQIVKLNGLLA